MKYLHKVDCFGQEMIGIVRANALDQASGKLAMLERVVMSS